MVQCPSCAQVQEPRIVCAKCGAPIAARLDLFAALGIARRLVIETDSLERAYHDLGRRIHPDRFATSPAAVRDASMRATALLTRAYRTLRDPVSRGLYWLELNGHQLAENNKRVPPELAELVFEVQEELAELRNDGDGGEKAALLGGIEERRAELSRMMDELKRELDDNFATFDASGNEAGDPLFAELKSILSKIAYLRTLIRDVGRELDSAKAA
ncbi:MAG TPA: Fe-S protein assembly co-chaperone HscB [Candidatus Binataceae bacterium]|nr:Fe-S protein assembly co-chaperone HscB [Candidatus Binataceae bacterium]